MRHVIDETAVNGEDMSKISGKERINYYQQPVNIHRRKEHVDAAYVSKRGGGQKV